LAPQGAPGGGCDNSHSDPDAAPPQWCEAGAGGLTTTAPASPSANTQADNLTAQLASEEGCCSFDGCKTCADWCTQQGKDVCLAPQGAPGGGCDNSHSDPDAAPPQWCEAGAGELSANDAPVSDDVRLASGDSCGQFCCWSGSDCGTCGDDWNSRMYEAGCEVPCSGANCGSGGPHQYFQTQPGALGNCNSPGFKCL